MFGRMLSHLIHITDLADGTIRLEPAPIFSSVPAGYKRAVDRVPFPPKLLSITYVKASANFNYLLLLRIVEPVEFSASVLVYLAWLPSSSCDEEPLCQRNQFVVKHL